VIWQDLSDISGNFTEVGLESRVVAQTYSLNAPHFNEHVNGLLIADNIWELPDGLIICIAVWEKTSPFAPGGAILRELLIP
jgi:hypothetical protein